MQREPEEPTGEPIAKKGSGYVPSEPAPWFGRMREGQVVEPDDDEESPYINGYEELRCNLGLREHG